MTLQPNDRVLFLAIPAAPDVARWAAVLTDGLLVAVGAADEVDAARAASSRLDNVMFIEARPGAIPWQEAFFSKIVVPPHLEPLLRASASELHRLLAPGGEIVLDRQDC